MPQSANSSQSKEIPFHSYMSKSNKALGVIVGTVLIVCVGAFIHAMPTDDTNAQALFIWIESAACLGLLLGGIAAFDDKSDLCVKASAFGRITTGGVAALLFASIWQWPYVYWTLAVIIGAILGHLGMLWAKYVDF